MERNPQENVKNDGDSSKEKGKLDFYFWVAEEVKNAYFLYTDQNILDHFLRDYRKTCSGKEHFVICSPCRPSDRVCHINKTSDDSSPNFFFVYDVFFTTLGLRLPYTDFEVECLNYINVAPSQLHLNSWVFIRSFEVLIGYLGTVLTTRVLFSLFQVTDVERDKWISLSGQPRKKIFEIFNSNFKRFKE